MHLRSSTPRTGPLLALALFLCALVLPATIVQATSSYDYGADEFVTIQNGMSPDHKYAITAHGGSDKREERFHIYLTDAVTGKKIGPLEEIGDFLDTGADAYCAKWSKASDEVTIIYRISRQDPLKAYSYHIAKRRAALISGPVDATKEQTTYWGKQCSKGESTGKVFGTPLNQ